jgi:iron complex transport system permease protein
MKRKHTIMLLVTLTLIWLVTLIVCSLFGPVSASFTDTLKLWGANIPFIKNLIGTGCTINHYSDIYWNIRMPRLILATLTGSALAVSGAAFQSIFRNPMADPYVLGVSSGASLGAALAIVLGWEGSYLGISGSAFVFALATIMVVYQVGSAGKQLNTQVLLLAGIAMSYLMSALVSILLVIHRDKIEKILFWTLGGFNVASWQQITALLPIVVAGISVIYFYARNLNIMSLGYESAPTLGVNAASTTRVILITSSFMISSVVAHSGVIGFVGLIIPHLVRIILGPDNRILIPVSIITGAIFLMISDTLARNLLTPSELPVGSITALFGVPYFLFLLYKSRQTVQ